MALMELTDANFKETLDNEKGLVLLDFGAEWCGPCKKLDPIVTEVAKDYDGKVAVAKIDIGVNREVAMHFGIMNVPTLLFLKEGKVVRSFSQLVPKNTITKTLDELLG